MDDGRQIWVSLASTGAIMTGLLIRGADTAVGIHFSGLLR